MGRKLIVLENEPYINFEIESNFSDSDELSNEEKFNEAEFLDEQMSLNEMALLMDKRDGFGISVYIYSNDHKPAHMHIYDTSTNELIAKVLIPKSKPSNINGIKPYDNYFLSATQKKLILKALLYKNNKKFGLPLWKDAIITWNNLHPNDCI